MELLGVTASVVGIIGFTMKALVVIGDLRAFCKDFSEEETSDFLHDLDTSARILVEVKLLCEKIDGQFPNRGPDFRIASLQVQVEDCTRDLLQLLSTAQHRLKTKNKFRQFKDFLTHVSKGHRAGPRERFRIHHENIKTALALTGRYLDAENNAQLHTVGDGVRQLARRLSDDMKEKSQALEFLSSSGSAVLALSRSTNDRLEDVQSTTNDISAELQDMKQLLLEVLSSSSSAISSRRERLCAKISNKNQGKSLKSEEPHNFPAAQSSANDVAVSVSGDERLRKTNDYSGDEHSQPRVTGKYETEISTILRASKTFAKAVHRSYNPFLADYTCTMYAWQTNDICGRLMKLELPTGFWNENTLEGKASMKMEVLKQRAQTKIIALRKKCLAEGLGKDLSAINAEMGISEDVLEAWGEEEGRRQLGSQCLMLESLESPTDQKKDRLTRLNEWLLQIRGSYEYLGQLHQSFWYFGPIARGLTKSTPFPEDWDRVTLKYWFFDSAAMMTEDYASSSQSGGDSEATYKPLYDNDDPSVESNRNINGPLGYTKFSIKQPKYPPISLSRAGVDRQMLEHYINTTADGFDSDVVAAAQDALLDYTRQRIHGGSVEIKPTKRLIIESTVKL